MKSINDAQDVFKKVHLSEKKIIFRDIIVEKTALYVKNEADEIVQLSAFRMGKDEKLYCAPAPQSSPLTTEQLVVVNFVHKEERYFFQGQLGFDQGIPWLNVGGSLYQLQRRRNARLEMPAGYPAILNLIEMNGQVCDYSAKLLDMSAGGCKILFPHAAPIVKLNDKIGFNLKLGHRRQLSFGAEVRFAATTSDGQIFGVQFMGRDNALENKLLVMMMDLQREIYMKYGPAGEPDQK